VYLVALNIFVATLGFAILKYGLYQIDRVIFRTLVYGMLAVFIAAVYVAIAVGVGSAIGSLGEPNLVVSLAATALVAIVFQPARERAEKLASRLVYGRRSSPYETLAKFSRQVAGALSVDEVLPRVAEVAAVGVAATRSRVRVYVPSGRDRAVAWPSDAVDAPFDTNILVLHQGQPVGELAIAKAPDEALTVAEQALLTDLAAQAGPALSNVRLAIELRTQADELRASRQRIVAAQDSERRRLERDIHDGAQQGLVALAINARLARELIYSDPREAEALLKDVGTQAGESLEALRNLARGIFPPVLSDRGLVAALEAHISKAFPRARLELGDEAIGRVSPELEAGIYFCCLEALQNCAKHAPASEVTVRIAEREPGWLTFQVIDSGPGFDVARTSQGSGLQHMSDRVAALGGSLEIHSREGNGTTIHGRVPVPREATV
jgi:signal transduction histidine kinase